MCKEIQTITFCSCKEEIEKTTQKKSKRKKKQKLLKSFSQSLKEQIQSYWLLYRLDNERLEKFNQKASIEEYEVGRFLYPPTEVSTQEIILKNLNQRNCFDFDYLPQKHDILKIYIFSEGKEYYYGFEYLQGKWHIKEPLIRISNLERCLYVLRKGKMSKSEGNMY